MSEIVKGSGFRALSKESLENGDGVIALNQMLKTLFDSMTSNGEGVGIYMGYATPESNVSAQIGSLYMRLDGGANTSLYVKESGDNTNTGWAAK